jgi:signal transduction histidine kinase
MGTGGWVSDQSANGVAYDLERLRDPGAGRPAAATRVGQHDVPVRLGPSRLVGRDAEAAELRDAFAAALSGQCAIARRVSLRNAQLYAENRRIADEQAALRRVATLVARGAQPQDVFIAVAEETGRLLKADCSALVRYDPPTRTLEIAGSWLRAGAEPPGPVGGRLPLGGYNVFSLVYETGRPARIDCEHDDISAIGTVAASRWGYRSSVGAPVIIRSRPWGALVVARSRQQVLPADTEARLAAFNELVGTAIANAEASAEVAASRARVIAAADQARRRIERDLHDGAQQRLVSLALQLRQAQAAVPAGLADLAAELDRAVTAANSALDEVGEIARGVHPAILTSGGLRPAVRALAHRSPVPTRLQECTDRRLSEYVEVTAYYVIAEALTNATKHALAAVVSIRAEVAGEVLVVTIRDDGVGGADPARGTGLTGLKDRVEALGGVMRIESPPGAGTIVRAELPLTADSRAVRDDRYAQ